MGIWKRLTLCVVAGALAAAGMLTAARAEAIPNGCKDDLWWTLNSTRRLICDGPMFEDGSWNRLRVFYTPAHNVPLTTNCYGTYSISCTTTGGYFVPYSESSNEIYPVTPATKLPDEPGYLGDATLSVAPTGDTRLQYS